MKQKKESKNNIGVVLLNLGGPEQLALLDRKIALGELFHAIQKVGVSFSFAIEGFLVFDHECQPPFKLFTL